MHRLVTKRCLVGAIDATLDLSKIHLSYHDSDHVLTLAYSLLSGGTRLEDVDRLRNDVPSMSGPGRAAAGSDHDRTSSAGLPRLTCTR